MFEMGIGGLIAAFVCLGILLLSLHLYSNWNVWIKAAATAVLVYFFFVTYASLPQLQGWPLATRKLPSKLLLVGVQISEPDTVFLWARDLDRGLGEKRPRAYALPYSKSLHQKTSRAGSRMRRGIPVLVEIEPTRGRAPNLQNEEGVVVEANIVRFTESPEGLVPEKD